MKLHPDQSNVQTITSYGVGWIAVNGERIAHSVIIGSGGQRIAWNCRQFADLDASHFAQLTELDAELVIFGSGNKIRFPQPIWLQTLMQRRLGLETMDSQAACRTYNILAGEGRKVVLAVLIEDAPA